MEQGDTGWGHRHSDGYNPLPTPMTSCGVETLRVLVGNFPRVGLVSRGDFSFPTFFLLLSSPVPGEPMARWPHALA